MNKSPVRFFEQLDSETRRASRRGSSRRDHFAAGHREDRNRRDLLEGDPVPERSAGCAVMSQRRDHAGLFSRPRASRFLRGRDFTVADNKDAPRVVLIDANAARAWFPDQDPIGRQLRVLEGPDEAA